MAILGTLIEQVRGVSYKPEDLHTALNENSVTLLRANNIKDGKINFDDVVYVDRKKVSEKQLLKAGDILICASSGSKELVGKAAYVESDLQMTFGAFCKVVRPKTDCPQYVGHFFNSPYYRERIANSAAGANINNIRNEHIDVLEIAWPSVEEQRSAVAVLDKVSELIALRKEQFAKLDQLVKSRFIELFGATSADKCSKRIKDYAEVLGGYAFKSDLFCTDAVPVIRISNINNGCVELDYNICFDELFWKQNEKFRAEQNDILMAMSGATTGKAGIYREDMPALINQRVACIRAKDGVACPTFLFVATQLEWMYDLIQETSAGCAQPNISGKQIENMPVPDASYEQQQQFASFVEQTDKSKLAIQQSLDKLELLKKSLMQEYFG